MSSITSTERKELKAEWKTETEVPVMTLQEVAKHNVRKDIYIVIHGKGESFWIELLYDVTEYARDHPGGPDALIEVAEADATSAYEDVGHSEDAREIMHPFLVGVLEGVSTGTAAVANSAEPAAATVRVVRQSPGQEKAPDAHASVFHPRIELVAFALGTGGLAWLIGHPSLLGTFPQVLPKAMPGHGGFAQGFLLAGVSSAIIAAASVRYLQKHMNFGTDFTSYPAHKHGTHMVLSSHHPAGSITPAEYRKFKLTSKTELSAGIWRFIFTLPTPVSVLGLPIGQHIAIRGYVEEKTITRSYTPVSNNRDLGRIELLIRIVPDGQLGKYLSKIDAGDDVEIRGPKGAMRYRKGMSASLGMIGGGTGITPLYQLIRAICEDKTDDTEISLVYANRSEADILLRQQLDRFSKSSGGRFKVHYMLDHPGENWTGGKGYINQEVLEQRMPKSGMDTKILICGPPGLVNACTKNLVALGFPPPGAVSKMSDQVFLF
ncbi:hypothetical protein LTR97_011766 [Elasticomyces elasticus]|uniref:Cytochrome-b5 reductase n=1 Tax=Elasticomyces elasticus TaxID=574655 RepID=A0AAN7VXU2_9PEZI|nr:hypothetical protein LTR97_011766 [Elasticomyces elasticus]